ncbi:MAG: ABC transporter ATP-binding protein [Bacteroidales bacterium]|nr:ABC transporter ATP-binding protein [Bacteroidales bacterium]
MKNIFRLLKYIGNYKKEVALNIIFNVLYVLFNLFSMVMIVPFVSVLFGLVDAPASKPELSFNKDAVIGYVSFELKQFSDVYGFFHCLAFICMGFVLFTLLGNVCRYLGFYFLSPIRNGVVRDLRNDVYYKLTVLPASFYSSHKRGDIISRMTSDTSTVEWSVFTSLQMVVKDPVMIIVYSAALILASWQFVVFILIVLPLPFLLIKKIGDSLNRNSLTGQKKAGELLSLAEESLSMVKVTKSLNAEAVLADRFDVRNNSYAKTVTKIIARTELASPLTEFFSIMILAIVVTAGGLFVLSGRMHPAILIAFTVIFSRIISPVKELITAYYNFRKGEAAAERINQILDAKEEDGGLQTDVAQCKFEKEIKFEHVGFSYKGNDGFSLQDVSFTVKKGQKVAIVGASGAGKSTVFDLFARFTDPTSGRITIDGTDIRKFSLKDLRSLYGVVTQDSILFNDSIKNNISFGLTDVSDEKIQAAARIANADEFIKETENGYDTVTGDRALQLSGGQRQRLCIARAVLRNPQILLMDEATSAMDTENEHKVTAAIKNAMQGRTMVVIAHRLSTVVDSDLIIVLDRGKIVETGSHEELLKKNGYYTKLIKLQTL